MKIDDNKMIAIFLIFVVSLCAIISLLLSLLSVQSQQQRYDIKKQNNFIICIMKVKSADRTQTMIDRCREDYL